MVKESCDWIWALYIQIMTETNINQNHNDDNDSSCGYYVHTTVCFTACFQSFTDFYNLYAIHKEKEI